MPKKTTDELIEDLALSVARGFDESQNHVREFREEVRQSFAAINMRLERVEFISTGQDQRISVLEDRIRQLSTKIGLQFN